MKHSRSSGVFRPFAEMNLKSIVKKKSLPLAPEPGKNPRERFSLKQHGEYVNDEDLFKKAMADVTPLFRENFMEDDNYSALPVETEENGEAEALKRLVNLIETGEGFVVADTAEYMEDSGYTLHPEITRRLHRGDFSMQSHIDLHGLRVPEAEKAVGDFLKESILKGRRAVLIVHGRGKSSPSRPVLKTLVYKWLTRGPWRKWVIAFTSARPCDGGTGATYVLLRQRPLTKSQRKKNKKKKSQTY